MADKLGVNVIIEVERQRNRTAFVASSPDINVLAEGETIDEAKDRFTKAVKFHLKNFPEDKKTLKDNKFEMPMVAKIFL